MYCLNLEKGETTWNCAFPAALDGPPTVVGDRLYLGSRDGRVHCLRASDGRLAWTFLAAPLERLTLSEDRLESLWPVSSSVLYHNGLIYALAGRNSYLDGGIRLFALDPATGAVRHNAILAGPWPDMQTLKTAVVTERDRRDAAAKSPAERESICEVIRNEYATGYNLLGGEADLLVTDGSAYFIGSGTLQVHKGTDGKLLAEYELPACPVFDGMSAAGGRLLIPMVSGELACFDRLSADK